MAFLEILRQNSPILAVLIDPDQYGHYHFEHLLHAISKYPPGLVLIGGSTMHADSLDSTIHKVRSAFGGPIVLFPGSPDQVSSKADGLLLLSLISGRNPTYLIGHHVDSARKLKQLKLEIIPTGYIHVDGQHQSTTSRVTCTAPICQSDTDLIVRTAMAAELLGMKALYLEAGSGAKNPVSPDLIHAVRSETSLPLIVGGGIRTEAEIQQAVFSGADMIVIGTILEENPETLPALMAAMKEMCLE